ncbi:E3 ubiquitin-protein ligase MARCHF5-like [Macrosteles quadrilineatus]|uniref:E3 ubiquitin-protein ligase MARCHF5-like n=1 Tax=Macrosteles quadrilineatus TaxID=74068 RepID=UPI0023E2AA75|nr:E3 ubiquitin-protein ligase MARCHF5-like [Macrosteles quadrilineatus]
MSDEGRLCYICLGEDGEDERWVSPCKCSGSLKWVHQSCIVLWVREQEATRPFTPAFCSQCRTPLRLIPQRSLLVSTMDIINKNVYHIYKYYAFWIFGIGVLDTVFCTFAVYAQSQVYGLDATLNALCASTHFHQSMLSMHFTAMSLVAINLPWEKLLLRELQNLGRLPALKWIFPEEIPVRYRIIKKVDVLNVVITSTLHPVVARVIGNFIFPFVESNLQRVLLGGLSFLAVKWVLSMYLQHKKELRLKKMRILPYQVINSLTVSDEAL